MSSHAVNYRALPCSSRRSLAVAAGIFREASYVGFRTSGQRPAVGSQSSPNSRSTSISALPGGAQLLRRAGYACVVGATSGRFAALTRPILATTRRGTAEYRHFRAFEVENAQLTGVR